MSNYLFPSSKQWYNLDVVGEYYHDTEIRRAALAVEKQSDGSYHFPVTLVAEPDNPHSTNGHAISVRNGKDVLGYIASEKSSDYFPEVARVCASGYLPEVNARLWCSGDLLDRDSNLYLYLSILDPGRNVPLNNPPSEGWALIPYGNAFQVTKESDHFDILQDYVPPSGMGTLLVTLHKEMLGTKTKRIGLEVRLDGERVGELSKSASEKLMPMVDHYDAIGLTSVARAIIQGSGLAAELTIHVKRAHELEDRDLEPEVSPLGRLVDYEVDPDKYEVPNAWQGASSSKTTSAKPPRTPRPAADPIPSDIDPELQLESNSKSPNSPSFESFNEAAVTSPRNSGYQAAPSASYVSTQQHFAVQHPTSAPPQINSLLMWLLWFFTGLVGGHRYYLGNIGIGILQSATFGGFGFWWVLDALLITRRKRAINDGTAPRWKF